MPSPLTDKYQQSLKTTRTVTSHAVRKAWKALPAYNEEQVKGFLKTITPIVQAGQVKAIAKTWPLETPSIDPATGEVTTRKSLPSDRFPKPFANDTAARAANNNAIPPDQSLIIKARHHGPEYMYSLLTGYQEQPATLLKKYPDVKTGEGLYYNPYFPNLNLAMAPPLTDGQVSYSDGTKSSVDQMAKDVTAFLTWAAEPKMENRKTAGWASMAYLLIFTGLAYAAYRTIWADKKKPKA